MQANRQSTDFSNKELISLFLPLILEQLLEYFVGLADSLMAAYIGESAMSGISLTDQIMVLIISVFAALSTGGAIIAGQYLGKRNEQAANKASVQLLLLNLIISVILTLVLLLSGTALLRVLFGDVTETVMENARKYFFYVVLSIPALALYHACSAVFRIFGNSRLPMIISIFMNGINIFGNAVFIYGFKSGAEGIAIPTLVSRLIAASVILHFLLKNRLAVCISSDIKGAFKPDLSVIRRILRLGIPNGIENSMFQFGKLMVLSLVSAQGTYAISANAVSNTITMFQLLPGLAINLGVPTVISRCVGAGEYGKAKYYNKKILKVAYFTMFLSVGMIQLLLPQILGVYHLSGSTEELAYKILTFHGISAILIWPVSFTLPSTFRASGDAKYCMTVSMVSMWVFRIAFSYILTGWFEIGVFGVWAAKILDWCFRSICFGIRYFTGKWMKKII